MNEKLATVNSLKDTLLDLGIRFGPRLLVAILILVGGAFVSRAVSRWLLRLLQRLELESPVRLLLGRVTWAACFLLFLIMALQNLGVELLPLIAGLGVAGAGIALATQGVLATWWPGCRSSSPSRSGWANTSPSPAWRARSRPSPSSAPRWRTWTARAWWCPNRKIVGEILHNYGRIRQLEVLVGVAYDTELQAAARADPRGAGRERTGAEGPEPVVQPVQLADSSVNIAVRPWVLVDDQGGATGELYGAIVAAFRARGIGIPFPQREVRLLGPGPS